MGQDHIVTHSGRINSSQKNYANRPRHVRNYHQQQAQALWWDHCYLQAARQLKVKLMGDCASFSNMTEAGQFIERLNKLLKEKTDANRQS